MKSCLCLARLLPASVFIMSCMIKATHCPLMRGHGSMTKEQCSIAGAITHTLPTPLPSGCMPKCCLFRREKATPVGRYLKLQQLLIKVVDGCWLVCAVHIFGLGELVSWWNSWIIKRSLKFPPKAEAPSYANCTYCIKPAEDDT